MVTPSKDDEVQFFKGHGTGNDFVILLDADARVDLSEAVVRGLCDRHKGIGADGVLRVVRTSTVSTREQEQFGITGAAAEWFMDYRNADGSIAETCGNGIRVFVHFLVLQELVSEHAFTIATRAGLRKVEFVDADHISVNMGKAVLDSDVNALTVSTEAGTWGATALSMPNPHCVALVDSLDSPGELLTSPAASPGSQFPAGANYEFITRIKNHHIAMRTFERGVGETLSCGSGACAAAFAYAQMEKIVAPWVVQVDVLGGTLMLSSDESGDIVLTGPSRIVASGFVDLSAIEVAS